MDRQSQSIAPETRQAVPAILVGFAIFALCFQGIFYFFEYRDGDSMAPTYLKLQKDVVWVIVLTMVFLAGVTRSRPSALLRHYNLLLFAFCAWIVIVKAADASANGAYGVAFVTLKNVVLYAAMVPLLGLLATNVQRCIAEKVLVALVAAAFAQTAFSATIFLFFPEFAFWKDDPYNGFDPFVGLFSNPNRFGLFLNMGAAALCAVLLSGRRWQVVAAAGGLIVLALSIFYSAALSQLIVFFGILGYATAITVLKVRWRTFRLPAVMLASLLAIGLIGLHFKSPLPDETHTEAALAWDLRNMASLALHGKTIDGQPFRFTSDSFVNRAREITDLLNSFGDRARQAGTVIRPSEKSPLAQRLFGRAEHLAPASQSQFAYVYFRYGLVGLLLLLGVIIAPAARSFLIVMRSRAPMDQLLLSYHLCLVAFIATFLGDNGLLDFPTNFLFFFVLFANQHVGPGTGWTSIRP